MTILTSLAFLPLGAIIGFGICAVLTVGKVADMDERLSDIREILADLHEPSDVTYRALDRIRSLAGEG